MRTINELYGNVDNLSGFAHPTYGEARFMPDKTLITLAGALTRDIEESGRPNIIVSETGAHPLAYVCERLLERRGAEVSWTYIKFPREPLRNLHPLIMFYLTEEERNTHVNGRPRAEQVAIICKSIPVDTLQPDRKPLDKLLLEVGRKSQNTWQRQMSDVLEGTKIARVVGTPFVYFDEYVDSGTTLQNANMYFNFFSRGLDFNILSYYMRIPRSRRFEKVLNTLFDQDSERQYFEAGAYPFENRLDIIGYFYYMDKSICARVTLDDLRKMFEYEQQNDPSDLLRNSERVIEVNDLVASVRGNFNVPVVRQYIRKEHVARQFLVVLEEETQGKGFVSEFLWQLADMYGPIWSPMPKENHFDFFSGTEKSKAMLKGVKGFEELKQQYSQARAAIVMQVSETCLTRKSEWFDKIDSLLGVYGNVA